MTKQDILAFFKKNIHAVVSTCGRNGQPEAALIGFGETNNLEIIFGTFNTARKYKNLQENNKVAFVIGWEDDFTTVQYEGTARELEKEELDHYLSLYHAKVPSAAHYQNYPQQRYFIVTPARVRYLDASGEEEKIVEISF